MDEAIDILERHLDRLYIEVGNATGRTRRDLQIRCDAVANACLLLRRRKAALFDKKQIPLPLEENT